MREVRTCDFCGEDATGVYEVVPAGAGSTTDARRMLLCDGCRDTLASVVDPLLAALDENGDASSDVTTGPATDGTEGAAESGGSANATEQDERKDMDTAADRDAAPDPALDVGDDADSPEAGGRPISERGPPRGYRKVLRFLENRELPMDRDDAEELVADAYGMGHEEVSAALDHAIKHDRLRDVNGELRR